MSAEDETQNEVEDSQAGGPGAPTPLSALEGVAGLTKRDIQLFIEGGYHTVESVAYTYVSEAARLWKRTLTVAVRRKH